MAQYPLAIPTITKPTASDHLDSVTVPHAELHSSEVDEIIAIATELGTGLKGTKTDLATRLGVGINADGTVKSNSHTHTLDDLSNVEVYSGLSNKQLLSWDSVTGVWRNRTPDFINLDQNTPQTVYGGAPIFSYGLVVQAPPGAYQNSFYIKDSFGVYMMYAYTGGAGYATGGAIVFNESGLGMDIRMETVSQQYAFYLNGAGDNLDFNVPIYAYGNLYLYDNDIISFGTGCDASIYYDTTNLVINPKVVGAGYLCVLGDLKANTLELNGLSSDPTLSTGGCIWFRTDLCELRISVNSTVYKLVVSPVG